MERHLSPAALVRLLSGQLAGDEADAAASHLFDCPPCADLAAALAAGLRKNGMFVRPAVGDGGVLNLLEARERVALRRLLAHGRWAELKGLPAEEQTRRLRSVPELQ